MTGGPAGAQVTGISFGDANGRLMHDPTNPLALQVIGALTTSLELTQGLRINGQFEANLKHQSEARFAAEYLLLQEKALLAVVVLDELGRALAIPRVHVVVP